MKSLILAVFLLAACTKSTISTYEIKKVFYKIEEVDRDGTKSYSEVRSTQTTILNKDEDEDEDDDDDEDDHHHCPLPIKIGSFSVVKLNSTDVKLYWESENEDNVSHYNIMKSFDTKTWNNVTKVEKGSGIYTYIDKN